MDMAEKMIYESPLCETASVRTSAIICISDQKLQTDGSFTTDAVYETTTDILE